MPILNYTTKIDYFKTISEIQQMLVAHGANKVVTDYENELPIAVTFCLKINDQMMAYSLPCNYNGVLKAMEKSNKVPRSLTNKDQALRVSWRIIKDWIAAQLAIVDASLVEAPEVFLPYLIVKSGSTLYNELKSNPKLLNY